MIVWPGWRRWRSHWLPSSWKMTTWRTGNAGKPQILDDVGFDSIFSVYWFLKPQIVDDILIAISCWKSKKEPAQKYGSFFPRFSIPGEFDKTPVDIRVPQVGWKFQFRLNKCILVGGLELFFIFHNIWDNPSNWLFFSRWLKSPTSILYKF